jgi:lysylphosphatidylglycerol synthetase-like protein (DUF2156 family)
MVWTAWPLDRILICFVGLAYLLIGIQVAMSHSKQNFHNKSMWVPVITAPILFVCSILLALLNNKGLYGVTHILYWMGTLVGFVGFVFHFRGVGHRVGGYAPRNFLMGPPIILPLLFAAMSVLGLISIYGR